MQPTDNINILIAEVNMLWWCGFLFALGILAFMDTIFNYGEIFRRINSVIFMLTSLGLLMRVSMKTKMRTMEGYINKIQQLEEKVSGMRGKKPKHPQETQLQK